jgi:uncharacterized protein YneF (UPF0154 family)
VVDLLVWVLMLLVARLCLGVVAGYFIERG